MVVEIDPNNPYEWRRLVPEYEERVLLKTVVLNDKILTIHFKDGVETISFFNYHEKMLKIFKFPIGITLGGFQGTKQDTQLVFYKKTYAIPPIVYTINTNTYKAKLVQNTEVTYKHSDFIWERVSCFSYDSTEVSILLFYKKGIEKKENNPVLLSAYGGYGKIIRPSFDPSIVTFLQKGGVFAFVNVRGGGEKGKSWHEEGEKVKKNKTQ